MSVLQALMNVTIILYASTILVHMSANVEVDSSYQVIKSHAEVVVNFSAQCFMLFTCIYIRYIGYVCAEDRYF